MGLEGLDGQYSLRMADDRHRGQLSQIQPLDLQRANRGQLRQQHTGHGDRSRGELRGSRHGLFGGQRTYPGER
ncbi:Uncharacterised protein [Mycobacteroides abscessus subsp. massiliense]|nr:Uncharacterised protein [Mycobacteroides abscessus subsp. massiliense]